MSNQDINIAYALLRRMNDGHEPYAASVSPMAREVAVIREAERERVLAEFEKLDRVELYNFAKAVPARLVDDLIAKLRGGQ